MAIQTSDYMDFGNGIIGDDTFDVWRKKTNRIQLNVDSVNTTLNAKIDTQIGLLPNTYVPLGTSGTTTAKTVHTALSFAGKTQIPNAVSAASALTIGSTDIFGSSSTGLNITTDVVASGLKSTIVTAENNLVLGTKNYVVPPAPSVNNAILTSTTGGALEWKAAPTILQLTGASNLTTQIFEEVQPVGSILAFAGPISDSNFLLCNGSAVSRTTYSDLFAVIAEIYGAGDGSTTFNLPDYQGRVPVGQGVAGGATFATDANPFGVTGGTGTTTSGLTSLTLEQMPRHDHTFRSDKFYSTVDNASNAPVTMIAGAPIANTANKNLGATGDGGTQAGTDTLAETDYIVDTGGPGASSQGRFNGTPSGGTYGSSAGHTHNITTSNRVQPYITVHYYIKAVKNSKVDFKINVANSGLTSNDTSGSAQTLISPVDGTVTLKVKTDSDDSGITEPSIRLVGSNLRLAASPFIQGSPKIRGVDLVHYSDIRAGGADLHVGRIGVHGAGTTGDLNNLKNSDHGSDHHIKAIHPMASQHTGVAGDFNPGGRSSSTGLLSNNDAYIINYASASPNAVGDFTGGVIINGTRTIAFQDGSFQHTAARPFMGKGVKKFCSRQTAYSGLTLRGKIYYISDRSQPITNGIASTGESINLIPHIVDNSSGDVSGYRNHDLPDNEEAHEINPSWYTVHCLTKSGKIFGCGYNTISGNVEDTTNGNESAEWARCFTDDDTVIFGGEAHELAYAAGTTNIRAGVKVSAYNDTRASFALDTNGVLWGVNNSHNGGILARGGTTDNYAEVAGSAELLLSQKRDEIAASVYGYTATTNSRIYVPHVMNPLKDSSGNLTTDPSAADTSGFYMTFTQAHYVGGSDQGGVYALGTDGKIYAAGHGLHHRMAQGNTNNQTHWVTIKTAASVDLTNIVEIYAKSVSSLYAKDSSGNLWAWGYFANHGAGNGSTSTLQYATKVWDANTKGVGVKKLHTSGTAGTLASMVFLITDDVGTTGPQLHCAGKGNHYETGQPGGAQDPVHATWQQIVNGPWDTSTHTAMRFFNMGGNPGHAGPNFTIAKNNSTGKLELWVTGYKASGYTVSTGDKFNWAGDDSGFPGTAKQWSRIRYMSDKLVNEIIDIFPLGQTGKSSTDSTAGYYQTLIHMSDGRLLGVGEFYYANPFQGTIYKFQELDLNA